MKDSTATKRSVNSQKRDIDTIFFLIFMMTFTISLKFLLLLFDLRKKLMTISISNLLRDSQLA